MFIINFIKFNLFYLRGNTRMTKKVEKSQFREFFFVKTNSLHELLSLYIRSTFTKLLKKNSLNNINICSLNAHWHAPRLKKHKCTDARAASERELWESIVYLCNVVKITKVSKFTKNIYDFIGQQLVNLLTFVIFTTLDTQSTPKNNFFF